MEGIHTFEFRETGEAAASTALAGTELPFATAAPEDTILTAAPSVFDTQEPIPGGELEEAPAGEDESAMLTTPAGDAQSGVYTLWRPREVLVATPDPLALEAGISHTAAQIADPTAREVYEEYARNALKGLARFSTN